MVAMIEMTKAPVPLWNHVPDADGIVSMRIDWAGYRALLALRGERARPRMHYLDGQVELMVTSRHHEMINRALSTLIEIYMLELGIPFKGYGQLTQQAEDDDAGAESDSCWVLREQDKQTPDLAIEVIWTHGSIDKREIYRRIGVPEVWFWKDEAIQVFRLVDGDYVPHDRSISLPELDLALLCRLVHLPTTNEAVAELKRALAAK